MNNYTEKRKITVEARGETFEGYAVIEIECENYGEDADGNRGIYTEFEGGVLEIELKDENGRKLSEAEIDEIWTEIEIEVYNLGE